MELSPFMISLLPLRFLVLSMSHTVPSWQGHKGGQLGRPNTLLSFDAPRHGTPTNIRMSLTLAESRVPGLWRVVATGSMGLSALRKTKRHASSSFVLLAVEGRAPIRLLQTVIGSLSRTSIF